MNQGKSGIEAELSNVKSPFIESFFYIYTAAILGHPRARSQYALFYLQNGLLPRKSILIEAIDGSGKFAFLRSLSPDIGKILGKGEEKMSEVVFMK
tara:strand:- start:590 stop:877 length:288 start_codon:yes stop_codon:yes gene_type:complete